LAYNYGIRANIRFLQEADIVMSTPTPQSGNQPISTAPAVAPAASIPPQKRQLIIYSHSNLFYWWPVWALGFLLTIVSGFGELMAIVPSGTVPAEKPVQVQVKNADGKVVEEERHVLALPKSVTKAADQPKLHISGNKSVGVVFVAVLLLVIFITNIPLRGLWSFVAIMMIIFVTIIFSIMDWWAEIFAALNFLDIRINMAGYLVISTVLFVLWLLVFFFFDRQMYMVFDHGQLRVCLAIGDGETSYDTTGMTTMKQRSDLFRHWVLGLGSGDLIVKTAGAHPVEIHMNNVLFIGRKHKEIEEMLRSREIVGGDNGR
jgi:hypothetical protein